MSSELNDSQNLSNQTEVRFSIRSVLILMAVLAGLISALGAFIRRFPPESRLRLGLYWGCLAALMVAMFIYTGHRRFTAEAKAGRVLFRFVPHSYMFPRAHGWTHMLMGIGCLAFAPAVWVAYSFWVGDPTKPAWQGVGNINVVYALMSAAAGFSFIWWRRIVVSENGLIIRNNFVPWGDCLSWYWDACNRDVVVVRTTIQSMTAMKVPAGDRSAIEQLLSTSCGSNDGSRNASRHNVPKVKPPAEPGVVDLFKS
jgi:hypothetical protein